MVSTKKEGADMEAGEEKGRFHVLFSPAVNEEVLEVCPQFLRTLSRVNRTQLRILMVPEEPETKLES